MRFELPFLLLIIALLATGLVACSSDSYLAKTSANNMGELSPIGSRQVVRQRQLAIANHYRISVATASGGLLVEQNQNLNRVAQKTLSQYLKQYFPHVNVINEAAGLEQALQIASQQGDQLLMYPRIENWPNIKPLRVYECKDNQGRQVTSLRECDSGNDSQQASNEAQEQMEEASDVLILTIAVFDVVAGKQVDAITARSRLGVKSYLYEDNFYELKQLNELVVNRLSAHANLH